MPSQSSISMALSALKSDFILAYSNGYVAKWSLWWALAMCGNFQVKSQSLGCVTSLNRY